MKKVWQWSAFVIVSCLAPVLLQGQFIGYTSPQTVQQVLASNVNCSGAVQSYFPQNLGQSIHVVTLSIAPAALSLEIIIQGVDSLGQTTPIGVAFGSITGSVFQSVASANGYYPRIRVDVICSDLTRVYTLAYFGTSSYPGPLSSTLLTAQNLRDIGEQSMGLSNSFNLITPPYGSSAGVLGVQSLTSVFPAGAKITLRCDHNRIIAQYALDSLSGPSTTYFDIPDFPCYSMSLGYTHTGASANLFDAWVSYKEPGNQNTVDPCQSNGIKKSSVPITAAATSTTEIVPLSANTSIYVCGFHGSHDGAGALQWEYGTGVACGTGTTALTGVETLDTNDPISYGPGSTIFTAPAGNALCIVTSVAGAFHGVVTYVQQ